MNKNYKSAVIIYHKNALNIYKKNWIIDCLNSIINQTYKKFDIWELCYDNSNTSLINMFLQPINYTYYFFNEDLENHVYAMNYLLNKIFNENFIYKYCFNINLDDYYDNNRFKLQIKTIKKLQVDLVSSQMIYIDIDNNIIKNIDILSYKSEKSSKKNLSKENIYIKEKLNNNNNIIAHPSVCYTKKFWQLIGPYNVNSIPIEDLELFKKAINTPNIKIHILKDFLLFYRIHKNQISNQI
jgi:hypothetical protein